MKNYFGSLLSFLLLAFLLLASCCRPPMDDDADFCQEEAIIIGQDIRLCACCGGWFIEIGNDTLRAQVLPQEFTETLEPDQFPVLIRLEWTPEESPCLGDEIEVSCIRQQ